MAKKKKNIGLYKTMAEAEAAMKKSIQKGKLLMFQQRRR